MSVVSPPRLFLLSPANCAGRRATQLLAPGAASGLAIALRSQNGVPIGDLFSFISGLYFRGKLTYARRFAAPPADAGSVVGSGVFVITPNAGLCRAEMPVTADVVRLYAGSDINADNDAYRRPLEQTAHALRAAAASSEVVLLGSIATPKYVDVLLEIFGRQLHFPSAFVGRGDMSRGGLLLRQAAAREELEYVPVDGAVRHGARPARLTPLAKSPNR
jgi:hypothetical protein